MMFAEFRAQYPKGALVSQMLEFTQGQYVVSVAVQLEGEVLATGMATATTLEEAEDRARIRALEAFGLVEIDYDGTVHLIGDSDRPDTAQLSSTTPTQALLTASTPTPAPTPAAVENTENAEPTKPTELASPSPTPPPPPGLDDAISDVPILEETALELDFAPIPQAPPTPAPPASATSPTPPRSPQPPPADPSPAPEPTAPVDLSDAIAQIGLLMRQLNWDKKQGVTHLQQNYGKRTRAELTDQELLEFLAHLQSLSSGEPDF